MIDIALGFEHALHAGEYVLAELAEIRVCDGR